MLAEFTGVEAHAGIRPEDGSNAIAAAAAAISRMELGRLDAETTANVGLIAGGTSGNVVPGHCGIVAEARSLDAGRAAEVAGHDHRRLRLGRQRARLRRRRAARRALPRLPRSRRPRRRWRWPRRGCAAPASSRSGSRSAAAATPTRCAVEGFDCVLLANGTEADHTADEAVPRAQPRRRCSRSARGSSPRRAAGPA